MIKTIYKGSLCICSLCGTQASNRKGICEDDKLLPHSQDLRKEMIWENKYPKLGQHLDKICHIPKYKNTKIQNLPVVNLADICSKLILNF